MHYKKTLVHKIKTLDVKIKAIKSRYDLDRKAAISPLPSGKFEKYEYLTGEDWAPKSRAIEKAKFEYFSLGQIFNKGLKKEGKEKETFKSESVNLKYNQNRNVSTIKDIRDFVTWFFTKLKKVNL